jgi:hypothetical protein
MKLIITESQYRTINEQFNSKNENNIVGDPSENTLMFADFLLKQDIIEIGRMLILGDEIEVYGFVNREFQYFLDNSMTFHVNVTGNDNDEEGDDEMRDEVFLYIQELSSQYPFVNWYFEGARL